MKLKPCVYIYIFFSFFCFFAIFASMGLIPSDTEYSIATAQSIVNKHSLAIEKTDRLWAGVFTKKGEYHSRYGLGYAFTFIPHVILAKTISKIFSVKHADYVLEFLVSFTNTFYAAIIGVLFFAIFIKLGYSIKISTFSTIAISCASILLPYAKIIHSETLTTLCLLIFIFVLTAKPLLDVNKGMILGILVSALYLFKIGNIPLSCIIATYPFILILKQKFSISGLLTFLLLAGLPFIILLFANTHWYGNAFNFGYGNEQKQFNTPLLEGLSGLLTSPSKSILIFSPLLIPCITAIIPFLKKQRLITIYIVCIAFIDLFFYAKWHDWHGGWAWGPRLVIPAILIFHVLLAESLVTFKKTVALKVAFVIIALFGFTINLLGCLVSYQQIYYFHKDYTSIAQSHPVIATRLLLHKIQSKPEVYNCEDFGLDCTSPAFQKNWGHLTDNNTVSFIRFEKYRGLALMWTGMADYFGWQWIRYIPYLLLLASVTFALKTKNSMKKAKGLSSF